MSIKNLLGSIKCKWSGHAFKHVQEYINNEANGYHWKCKRCGKKQQPIKK